MRTVYQQASAQQRETPEFKARLQAMGQALSKDYAHGTMVFIQANPTSWVSLYSLEGMGMMVQPQYAEVAPLYEALSPELRS